MDDMLPRLNATLQGSRVRPVRGMHCASRGMETAQPGFTPCYPFVTVSQARDFLLKLAINVASTLFVNPCNSFGQAT